MVSTATLAAMDRQGSTASIWGEKFTLTICRNMVLGGFGINGDPQLAQAFVGVSSAGYSSRWQRFNLVHKNRNFLLTQTDDHKSVLLSIAGAATTPNARSEAMPCLRSVAAAKDVVINVASINVNNNEHIHICSIVYQISYIAFGRHTNLSWIEKPTLVLIKE